MASATVINTQSIKSSRFGNQNNHPDFKTLSKHHVCTSYCQNITLDEHAKPCHNSHSMCLQRNLRTEYCDKTEANSPLLLRQHAPNSRTRKPRCSFWGRLSVPSSVLVTLERFKPQGIQHSKTQSWSLNSDAVSLHTETLVRQFPFGCLSTSGSATTRNCGYCSSARERGTPGRANIRNIHKTDTPTLCDPIQQEKHLWYWS